MSDKSEDLGDSRFISWAVVNDNKFRKLRETGSKVIEEKS